jgi:tellurite methyltransferase
MPDWDEVYTEKQVFNATPAEVLIKNKHLLSTGGKALDYACGLAGNGCYLEKMGYDVSAWDLSDVAVTMVNQHAESQSIKLHAQKMDLENELQKKENQFDIIVVSYFLHRETLRNLYDLLKKDALLFYETFSGQRVNQQGPSREAFRLKQGELLNVFSDMQLVYYREDIVNIKGSAACAGAKQGRTYFVAKK